MTKSIRLRNAREAGLVLPQSGYEMSNDEMMYVDGGINILAALADVGRGIAAIWTWVNVGNWIQSIGRGISAGIKVGKISLGKAAFLANPIAGAVLFASVLAKAVAWGTGGWAAAQYFRSAANHLGIRI